MKVLFYQVLIVCACVVCISHSGSALKCYTQCSAGSKGCISPDDMNEEDCPPISTLCQKTTTADWVFRTCGTLRVAEGCTDVNGAEICNYYCDTDLCNGQETLRPSVVLALLAVLGYMFAARMR